jgi:predicted DNA-binding antitoxin AbrB/MazE fold protein
MKSLPISTITKKGEEERTMTMIRAIVRNGQFEPIEPITLPEGTKVIVSLPESDITPDEDWDTSPEAIAARLAAMETIEPIFGNDTDRDAFENALREQKEWELAHWDEYTDKLKRMFS